MAESDRSAASVTNALVAAATAAAATGGRPEDAITAAALIGAFQPVLQIQMSWALDVLRRFLRRRPMAAAQLEEELSSSVIKQALLIRALDLSRTAAAEEKRRAIAKSIAAGFASDSAAAIENDTLRVVADLDLAHVLALSILSNPSPISIRAAFLNPIHFEAHDLGVIDDRLVGLEDRVLAVLVSHGLVAIDSVPTYNSAMSAYRTTAFGVAVLERFTSVDDT